VLTLADIVGQVFGTAVVIFLVSRLFQWILKGMRNPGRLIVANGAAFAFAAFSGGHAAFLAFPLVAIWTLFEIGGWRKAKERASEELA
jgi:hypothetical protein